MLQWLHQFSIHSLEFLHSRGLDKPDKLEGNTFVRSFQRQALTGWWQTSHLSWGKSKRWVWNGVAYWQAAHYLTSAVPPCFCRVGLTISCMESQQSCGRCTLQAQGQAMGNEDRMETISQQEERSTCVF